MDEVFGSDSGDVTVTSGPGKGSVFTVRLPASADG
jgi:signal transduction histidine kinase